MPIYEYRCRSCHGRFETLAALGADAADCPSCGATGAERLLSSFQAGPGRRQPSTFTPAQTRRDAVHGPDHRH